MKKMRNLLAMLLALTMILCLCACGNDAADNDTSTTASTNQNNNSQGTDNNNSSSSSSADNSTDIGDTAEPVEYVYSVSVVDIDGNPIEGVFVQICAGDTCVPKKTDANGIAGYEEEISGDGELTAKIVTMPEGYEAVDGITEIVMEGVDSVEFVLQAEVEYVYTVQVITTEDVGLEGVFVQICAGDTCVPKKTDARGFAGYEEEITGNGALTVKLINVPAGYELAEGETMEIVLEDGCTDAIFVLKASDKSILIPLESPTGVGDSFINNSLSLVDI